MGINLKESKNMQVDFTQLPIELREKIFTALNNNTIGLVNVKGDSMQPTIEDKGMVLMDTSDTVIENDCAYVFKIEGGLYKNYDEDTFCKRLSVDEKGKLTITSENGKWKPFHFDSVDKIEIIGKVLAAVGCNCNVLKEVSNKYEIVYPIPIVRNMNELDKVIQRQKEIDNSQKVS